MQDLAPRQERPTPAQVGGDLQQLVRPNGILLLYSALVRISWNAVSCSGLLSTRDMELLELGQPRVTKMVKGLEYLPAEERLRELGQVLAW